jgi:hypothetical protein
MLMMKEQRLAFRTIEGWVKSVLLEAGAIRLPVDNPRPCSAHTSGAWVRPRQSPG